jgi:hypothetical protein
MATYQELRALVGDSDLIEKIEIALAIKADTIRALGAGASANAKQWVTDLNAESEAKDIIWMVLAANKGAAVGAITGASDATIQTAVDAAVDFKNGDVV